MASQQQIRDQIFNIEDRVKPLVPRLLEVLFVGAIGLAGLIGLAATIMEYTGDTHDQYTSINDILPRHFDHHGSHSVYSKSSRCIIQKTLSGHDNPACEEGMPASSANR